MPQTTPVYEASYTGNTPIADIIKTDIPPEPPSNQWVKASMTVKNVGTTPGRIYAYVANHEWSDEEFSLRAAGGEWVLRPGEPGIAIVTAYDVQPGEQVVFDLEFFFPKAGTYWIKLEAGHVEDPYLIKDDERTTWIEASGALWVKLTPDKTRGTPPLTVHFDVDFGGGVLPITFTIDYGDGSPPDTWVWTGSGAIPGFVHTYDYPGEYEVTLTAVDASGVTKQDKATIIVEAPATPYTLSVSVGTGGSVNLYINDVLYDTIRGYKSYTIYEGTNVKLKAVPDDGYEFDYWLLDGVKKTERELEFTMSEDVNASAYFKKAEPTPSTLKFVDENNNPIANAEVAVFNDKGETIASGSTDQNGEISISEIAPGEYWVEAFKEAEAKAYDAIAKITLPGSYTVRDSWFTERVIEVTMKLEAAGEDWMSSILNGMVSAGMVGAWILWITPFTPLWQINQLVNGILLNYLKQQQPEGIEFLYAELNPTERTITVGFKQKVASPVSKILLVIALIIAVAVAIGAIAILIHEINAKAEVEARSEAIESASDIYEQASNLLETVNQKLEAGEISPEEASQVIDALTRLMESMEKHIRDLGGTPPTEGCKILFGTIDVGPLPEPWCSIANGVSSVAAVGLAAYLAYKLIGLIPKRG